MQLKSPHFEPGEMIPEHYTCTGRDISPPLSIEDIPLGARSLALTMHDPDSQFGTWVHWVAYDMPVNGNIVAGESPGTPGKNSFGWEGYGGPCPAAGTHRYVFTVFAVDAVLRLPPGVPREELLRALEGHIIEQAELVGRYRKPPAPEPFREIRI